MEFFLSKKNNYPSNNILQKNYPFPFFGKKQIYKKKNVKNDNFTVDKKYDKINQRKNFGWKKVYMINY